MNYADFKNAFVKDFPRYLPAQYQDWEIRISECIKINGSREMVNVMAKDEMGASPNLYLDDLFAHYKTCRNMTKVCQKAAATFVAGMDYISRMGVENVMELPHDRVIFVLIPQLGNERLLTGVPHRLTLDLAVVYRIVLEAEDGGFHSAIVTHDMAEEMELSEEELYSLAMENTPEILPKEIRRSEGALFILTNERSLLGASTMLYPGALAELAETMENDLFILPASLHEVFAIPDMGQNIESLNRIIVSANETALQGEELLANHVYYYHRETDQVCIPKWE